MTDKSDKSDKTEMQKVKDFNRAFQVEVPTSVQYDLFTRNPALVKLKLDLIREEFNELEEAVAEHNLVEVMDALCDLKYVIHGMAISFGLDTEKGFSIVHESNMSKLCRTEEEAQKTVDHYQNLWSKGKSPYDSPYFFLDEKTGYYIVKNKSTGKILKNINYHPADFSSLLNK